MILMKKVCIVFWHWVRQQNVACSEIKTNGNSFIVCFVSLVALHIGNQLVLSTGVTWDTQGNFAYHIKFSLFCLFLVILCMSLLSGEVTSVLLILHYIGPKTRLWPDTNISNWCHMLKNWWNLSCEWLWHSYFVSRSVLYRKDSIKRHTFKRS